MNPVKRTEALFPPIKSAGPPKVWKVIESVRKKSDQEVPIKFSIQEIPEDRYEDAVEYMITYFIPDEPVCKSVNGKNGPLFVDDFRTIWREIVKQGLSVGAFVENPDGGKPIIAGINVLGLDYKDRENSFESIKWSSPITQLVMNVILDLCKQAQVYEKYNVDRYMFALGLSVNPRYRGESLGGHILRARENIGREYNIPVTSTAFTSPISQKLASRVGFEILFEKDYEEILTDDGKLVFPNIEAKSIKIMGKRLY